MKTIKLALAVMLATGLAAAPFAAQAKSHKKHHSSMSQTTGANMKSKGSEPTPQGGTNPGSDQSGMTSNKSAPSNTK